MISQIANPNEFSSWPAPSPGRHAEAAGDEFSPRPVSRRSGTTSTSHEISATEGPGSTWAPTSRRTATPRRRDAAGLRGPRRREPVSVQRDRAARSLRVVPQPAGLVEVLTMNKAAGDDLTLAWSPSCTSGDFDYEIYEGSLERPGGQFVYSHESRFCSTTFTPASGSTYYLVVPRNGVSEGSYGRASDGTERPAAADACLGRADSPTDRALDLASRPDRCSRRASPRWRSPRQSRGTSGPDPPAAWSGRAHRPR